MINRYLLQIAYILCFQETKDTHTQRDSFCQIMVFVYTFVYKKSSKLTRFPRRGPQVLKEILGL